MIEYECPICQTLFFGKESIGDVHDHFKREHPVELESITMIRRLLELFNRIGWPQ